MNILKLEKRGCDFSPFDDTVRGSDIGNYRLVTGDYSVPAANGMTYYLEFHHYDKWTTRRTNKRTGKPLARPVRELVANNVAGVSAYYLDDDGVCWGDVGVWEAAHDEPRPYTEAGILDIVNSFAAQHYDAIEYIR